VGVVGRHLVMPDEFSRFGIESEDRAGVKIVALALIAVEVGTGIADAPIEDVGFGIVGAGHPGGRAGMVDGSAEPGFGAGFAGRGNRPEAPDAFTGGGFVGGEEAADAFVAARDSR